MLLRHASAGDKRHWSGDDALRPLDARGRDQATQLVELLRPLAIRRVVTSPYVRCVESVEPLAAALGLTLERDDRLGEGMGSAAAELLRADGVLACTHGDIVDALLARGLKKGAAVVLEDGEVVREIPAP
ncbi:MAG TPA: phosphoglycerate mutase family protein [Gaiellaceae bacterium]